MEKFCVFGNAGKLPSPIAVIRKYYRFDGGGELQTRYLLDALSSLTSVELFCVNWDLGQSTVKRYKINFSGSENWSDANFAEWAIREARENCIWVHGQDWIPGSDSIRLGDGLHSKFLKLAAESVGLRVFNT